MMIAAVVGILGYTFVAYAATQVATGREDDPFGNGTLANTGKA